MFFHFQEVILAFAATAQSVAVTNSHVVHEKRDSISSKHWVKREKLSSNVVLPMRIGLKQRNLHLGHELLMDISHPDSDNYGKHWTSDEVIDMFSPEQETVDAVKAWLVEFGIAPERVTHSDNKGWLAFDATTEEAESLLHTKYHLYEHTHLGHKTAACESYKVPLHIQEHIDYVTPGIKLSAPSKRGRNLKRGMGGSYSSPLRATSTPGASPGLPATAAGELSTCDKWITPACIRALYSVPETPDYAKSGPRDDNSMGIFEEGDFFVQGDLDLFFANFTPHIPKGTQPTPAYIDGSGSGAIFASAGESNLDLELAYPLIYPQTITVFQTDDEYYSELNTVGSGFFNTFLDALDGSYCSYSTFGETGDDPHRDPVYPDVHDFGGFKGDTMCGVFKPTNVISVSYDGSEVSLPAYYQQRQCNEFMKLGLQGHSIFFASGDSGVAGPHYSLHFENCLGGNRTIFNPGWPNTCPYVTNVGATKVYPNRTVHDPESAAFDPVGEPFAVAFSSGGGFSNIYPIPDYQKAAVDKYFKHNEPPYPYYESKGNLSFGENGGVYNRLGRAYPDVSANGDNIAVFFNGQFTYSAGTSASAPMFASLINRINELRLNAGKSTVGFINPALYSHPEILNDITNGTNPGCGTKGFSAAPGWDPVTGLGTPNFPKMVKFFMSLP